MVGNNQTSSRIAVPAPIDPRKAMSILLSELECAKTERQPALRHPNGFTKIPLEMGPAGRQFVHLWTADAMDAHIHDHRWSFSSTVLHGSLTNLSYSIRSPGAPNSFEAEVRRYEVYGPEFRFDSEDALKVQVGLDHERVTASGLSYVQPADTLHRAHATEGAITIVNRGPHVKPYARVLFEAHHTRQDERQTFEYLTWTERQALIRHCCELAGRAS